MCTRVNPALRVWPRGDLAVGVLDPDLPVPLHQQLTDLLRAQVADGR